MIVGDDGLQSWHGETDTYLGINIIRAAMAAQQGSKGSARRLLYIQRQLTRKLRN